MKEVAAVSYETVEAGAEEYKLLNETVRHLKKLWGNTGRN
jgi:hypothetical protein